MIFKSAQASMPIYLFDRNSLTVSSGKVTSVVPSHVDTKMQPAKIVVDITASIDDKTQMYTIEDSLSVAYFGSSVISLDREVILREIETMKHTSEQLLQDIDKHKEIVTKCGQLLLDNNPQLKEKKENEERFTNIENKIDKLANMLENFIK